MNKKKKKISALYDGELSEAEVEKVLLLIDDDPKLQKKLSRYSLITASMNSEMNNVQSISSKNKDRKLNFWISNTITAAATVLITFFAINQFDLNRMGEDLSAKNQINIAINSQEAKDLANRVEEKLVDHVMHVINNPENDNVTPYDIDLRNVGYSRVSPKSRTYNNGNKKFILRIEKKDLGIKNVRNWQHKDKMIYVVPLQDGRVITLYGNIDQESVTQIANTIKK